MSVVNIIAARDELLDRTHQLVGQHWLAIEAVARNLLAQQWLPQVRFESGARWSHESTTVEKHIDCGQVIKVLTDYGISAECDEHT